MVSYSGYTARRISALSVEQPRNCMEHETLSCHLLSALLYFLYSYIMIYSVLVSLVLAGSSYALQWICTKLQCLCFAYVLLLHSSNTGLSLFILSFFVAKCTCCQELSQLSCHAVVFPATGSDCLDSLLEKGKDNIIVAWHLWTMIWGTKHIYRLL